MESSSDIPLFDTTDILLLSAIGLGTIAWFTRHQLLELLVGKKQETTTPVTNTAVPKRETNFVKIMQQQVSQVHFEKQFVDIV